MNRNLRGWAHELRVRGATRKASPISRLMVASLPLRLRRRPIQFSVAAAVEAGEAVAGFASGIRHGGKGDGSVIEGASGLIVEEMHFGHHGNRGAVTRWGRCLTWLQSSSSLDGY